MSKKEYSELTLEDGTKLVKFARENIEHYLQTGKRKKIPEDLKVMFSDKAGAFVTLSKGQAHSLRGCIGYILPKFPLIETIKKVSISAATEDPRFPKISLDEMDKINVEVSVLTVPEEIKADSPEKYLEKIKIGRDGLIVTKGSRRGLLLPQVPVEHDRNWDVKTFLEHTCRKAWLGRDAWKDIEGTNIEKFTAIIFEEKEPRGGVRRKEIGE